MTAHSFARPCVASSSGKRTSTFVGEAENGKEAVKKAQELPTDLILLDLSMPVVNGLRRDTCSETDDAENLCTP